ncbi:hypothetical protein ACFL1B_00660 [Nanoarchaeota archaeon]
MAVAGFVLLLVNAANYLFHWEGNFTPIGIIGLVLVVTGMNLVKKSEE